MNIRFYRFLCLALMGLAPTNVLAQNAADESSKTPPAATEIQGLVEKLGSPRFAERQAATVELMKLEADAVPVLEALRSEVTGEPSIRLWMLLPELRKRLLDDRLKAFFESPSVQAAERLPEWDRFSAIAGESSDALKIFGEVLQAERELFVMRLFSSPDFAAELETRSRAFAELCDGKSENEFPIATCVALMLLGSDAKTRLISLTSNHISDALDDPRFGKLVDDGVHAATLKAVVGAWINRPGISVDRPLRFSMQHKLSAGRPLAHTVINSGSRNQRMYYALLCLAQIHEPEDLPLVESLFKTPDVLWPPRNQAVESLLPGAKSNYSVQTRDVALTVAIHLRGRDPGDFGSGAVSSTETVYDVYSLGFDTDEARAAALEKYKAEFPDAADSAAK